jgi:hypothetical protein
MKMEFKFTLTKTAIQVANLKINPRIRIQYKQLIFYVFILNGNKKIIPKSKSNFIFLFDCKKIKSPSMRTFYHN